MLASSISEWETLLKRINELSLKDMETQERITDTKYWGDELSQPLWTERCLPTSTHLAWSSVNISEEGILL